MKEASGDVARGPGTANFPIAAGRPASHWFLQIAPVIEKSGTNSTD